MSNEFRLADIGEGLEEAEIIAWRVQIGDRVFRDQPIVEVMTDKSNAELPAPVDGVVVALGGEVGDIIEVGSLLAVIEPGASSEAPSADDAAPPVEAAPEEPESDDTEPVATPTVSTFQVAAAAPTASTESYSRPQRPKASPTTRVEAARRGIDLAAVQGTGPGGRILLTDLDPLDGTAAPTEPAPPAGLASKAAAAETVPPTPEPAPAAQSVPTEPEPVDSTPVISQDTEGEPAPPPPEVAAPEVAAAEVAVPETSSPATDGDAIVEPLRGIRRAIARNMDRSWSQIPHIHSFQHIDAEPLLELREQLRSSGRPEFAALTPLSFFVAAVANAIEQHPIANATLDLDAETITHHDSINIGVAVAAPQGLVVPVIPDAGNSSLASIADAVRATVDGARTGSLPASAFRDGTVTITNFGSLGGEQALPLIRPPESVIFGFGSIAARPFVIDGEVVARKTMHLVIGTDHRLLDGDVTTALLGRVASLLENPINLVLGD
jgi:pyruvate dehydrogenase E2 component (dihydrolipoamide acetyltransferase)